MIGAESGWDWERLLIAILLEVILSIGFDVAICAAKRNRYLNQYLAPNTWLLVVIGVLYTLLLATLVVGVGTVMVLLSMFAAGGIVMAIGEVRRHVLSEQQLERMRQEAAGDDAA